MVRLLLIACGYTAAVCIAENTVGNAGFLLYFWCFERIPAWQWSLPVHGAGFLWIVGWTFALRCRPEVISMIVSWIFFAAAELLNRCWFQFFDYGREPFGANFSFVAVLLLYAMLCFFIIFALRKWVFRSTSICS